MALISATQAQRPGPPGLRLQPQRDGRVRGSAWSGFFGIATADGASDVAEKRGYREIALGLIQRQRFGISTSGLQDDRTKTAATNLFFQVSQDLSGDAATSRARSHKHALDLSALLSDRPERTAAHRVIRCSCDHEISAGLFELGYIDPVDWQSWIQRA